jgi:methionyl-tRNA formyltransferase
VLEALIKRGENRGVYVAPEKEGAKADPVKEAALAAKLPAYRPDSCKKPAVWDDVFGRLGELADPGPTTFCCR